MEKIIVQMQVTMEYKPVDSCKPDLDVLSDFVQTALDAYVANHDLASEVKCQIHHNLTVEVI